VVVVHDRHYAVAVPAVQRLVVENPVAEQREVVRRLAIAARHPLEFARHALDPEGRVQAALRDDLPGVDPATADFTGEQETLFADALRELAARIAEGRQRLYAHVLGGIDAKSIQVGVRDPEAIGQDQAGERR